MDEPKKPLQTMSFVVHATRGVIRDQRVRRKAMMVCLIAALLLVVSGFTILRPALNPREHAWAFLIFWAACGWLSFTAMLLAVFDMLMVRLQARRQQRALRERLTTSNLT